MIFLTPRTSVRSRPQAGETAEVDKFSCLQTGRQALPSVAGKTRQPRRLGCSRHHGSRHVASAIAILSFVEVGERSLVWQRLTCGQDLTRRLAPWSPTPT